jgi:hypothetical protein
MPCVGGPITSANLTADGVLDIPLRAIGISGAVTLNGAPLPAATGDRGTLTFARTGGGGSVAHPLQSTGPTNYAFRIMPGTFVAAHEANAGLCGPGIALPSMPCASQIVLGCD